MSLQRQVTFWVAALAILAALLWLLSPVLMPCIAGMALAYLLDPLTRQVERSGIGRSGSAGVVILLIIVIVVTIVMLVAPILAEQLFAFVDSIPKYIDRLQALISAPNREWLDKMFGGQIGEPGKSAGGLIAQGATWLATFLTSLWSGGRALVSLLSLLIITPVVAFYLLSDWERLVATVDGWIPLQQRETVRGLAREMDAAIAGFVRGQAIVCLVLGVFYAIGLTLCGLHFGFLIGFGTGVMGFIPFVGALTGFLVAGGVAIAQFWPNWVSVMAVIGVFVVGQVLEGYILSPNLVGKRVGLHPVWLMFSLLAFGYLFGFVGLLVAVPLAAAIGVLTRFALRQYLASPIYTGGGPR
jgi:predicted PurR-regulated permease PerM